MESLRLGELRFLRSVPPYECSYGALINEYFVDNDSSLDGWGLLHDILETYEDPGLVRRYNICHRKPWKRDDFGVIDRYYGDCDTPNMTFDFYCDVINLVDNFNIVKQYRILQKCQKPDKETIMFELHWEDKIKKAENFLRNT